VAHDPPGQLLPDEAPEEAKSSLFEELLNPIGAKILAMFLLPHLSHFISQPLLLVMTNSLTLPQSLHL
jgi:hypothetical protein